MSDLAPKKGCLAGVHHPVLVEVVDGMIYDLDRFVPIDRCGFDHSTAHSHEHLLAGDLS